MPLPFRPFAALACAAALLAGGAASSDEAKAPAAVLSQARAASLQIREGRYELAPQSIAALETAAQDYPRDVRVLNALGVAYFEGVTAAFNANRYSDIPVLIGKARDAHARALKIDPKDPEALSGHGTALAVIAGVTRKAELGRQGITEINQAAAIAPNRMVVTLQRAFTNLGVAPELRDRAAAEDGLKRLVAISGTSRAGDVLNVLLGDLYAEAGQGELSRPRYAKAARAGSTNQALAESRLALLGTGTPPPAAEVTRLRNDIARNCAMCHAR